MNRIGSIGRRPGYWIVAPLALTSALVGALQGRMVGTYLLTHHLRQANP